MPLTTRSTDDLLGHAWDRDTDFADPLRPVLTGSVSLTGTDQHITFFREATTKAEVDAEFGIAEISASASRTTHLLYDVRVTGLATLATGTQHYNAESGCCMQGNPTDDCQAGYVNRLLRGSGTIKMLQKLSGSVGAGVRDVLMARGGARYRVLDESSFNDAYFAIELTPLESICRNLAPEQEIAPLQLKAPPNCVILRYSALGEKETLSRQLPNEQLCRAVAERYCGELSTLLSCRVRFADADEADVTAKPEVVTAETAAPRSIGAFDRDTKKK
jgi:hypothetical protein